MADSMQQVEFSSRVSKEDYDEFNGNFPLHGATSWFIRAALKEFNKQCRENKTVVNLVRDAISEMSNDPQ